MELKKRWEKIKKTLKQPVFEAGPATSSHAWEGISLTEAERADMNSSKKTKERKDMMKRTLGEKNYKFYDKQRSIAVSVLSKSEISKNKTSDSIGREVDDLIIRAKCGNTEAVETLRSLGVSRDFLNSLAEN